MSQVDFHTLDEASDPARLKTACTLIETAFLAGERVLVWLDESGLNAFDNLLWTFSDRAFVPHEMLAADPNQCEAPVQLTALPELPVAALSGFSTLVQLRAVASVATLEFPTVIEVIDADPARREAGRARFRFYREHGVEPQHHKVTAKT
jgi:DNA polymerase III subunit chi